MLEFLGLVVIAAALFAAHVYANRHPLTDEEIARLARKWQRSHALREYSFAEIREQISSEAKGSMRAQGEFVTVDFSFSEAPAKIAGFLKYKKHEWIVVAYVSAMRVRRLWWNKGPDGTQVSLGLQEGPFLESLSLIKPDAIAIFHNHPNSNPRLYQGNQPSAADIRSAEYFDDLLSIHGISLLEFICERGAPYLYYASFDDCYFPNDPWLKEIATRNGRGVFENYALRLELVKPNMAEQIPGKRPLLANANHAMREPPVIRLP